MANQFSAKLSTRSRGAPSIARRSLQRLSSTRTPNASGASHAEALCSRRARACNRRARELPCVVRCASSAPTFDGITTVMAHPDSEKHEVTPVMEADMAMQRFTERKASLEAWLNELHKKREAIDIEISKATSLIRAIDAANGKRNECQWCGDTSYRCEMFNGSCGWLLVAATYWEALDVAYRESLPAGTYRTGLVSFESALPRVRRAHATAARMMAEKHHVAMLDMLPKREDGCTCHQIMAKDSRRHFKGCPLREPIAP